jgi:hypothetical protein
MATETTTVASGELHLLVVRAGGRAWGLPPGAGR